MSDFPLPAGSIVKAVFTFEFANIFCEHRMYFKTKAGISFISQVCVELQNNMCFNFMLPLMCTAVRFISVTVSTIDAGVIFNQTLFPHDPTYGWFAELAASPVVANVNQFRTDTAGRTGRGRMLRFGFPLAYVENYVHLTDYAYTQIRLVADNIMSWYGISGDSDLLILGVFSNKLHSQGESADVAFSPIKAINVSKRLTSCGHRRS